MVEKLSIVIPKKSTVICPDQVDMNDKECIACQNLIKDCSIVEK